MGKVNSLHKLVPCRSSCKRLSKEEFKDTALVWFKVPADNFTPEFWVLDSREKFESLHIDLSKEEYYPAPTAHEFTEKMQTLFIGLEGTSGDYLVHHIYRTTINLVGGMESRLLWPFTTVTWTIGDTNECLYLGGTGWMVLNNCSVSAEHSRGAHSNNTFTDSYYYA